MILLTPAEAFKKFYPDAQVEDKDLTVLPDRLC